ncbi:LysR family transcriptional regulator [Nocardia sp. CC227C]|uniref:LysR family transcriptional regulator n=1 Tax=Nocardia sp. CC227C TaxID=3044562 RepID=UPI00278C6807|nr:LysR family transcriptional regulator [Nocardia sp. CC227C]
MERHEIETFLALAEELHFARTAERLRVSPGRVSQTIKKLERRIGGPLFERSSRRVALTSVGQRFQDELNVGYALVQQAIHNATEATRNVTGPVRLAFSSPWCGALMFRAADQFRDRYPGCEVRIQEMSLADSFGPLTAGEVDLQLSEWPTDEPGIVNGPVLFTEPPALLTPRNHPLAQRDSVSLEDLAPYPLITFSGLSPGFYDRRYPHRTPSGAPIRHDPVAMTFHEILCYIGEGKGVTILSARAEQYHSRQELTYIPLSDAPPVEYGLLWHAGRDTAAVRAFVETISHLAKSDRGER